MNYSNNIDQIVFLKDRDIVLSIDGTNLSGAVLSNGIPSYDLLSAQVNILSSRDDFLSNYISNYIEVSCSNLCTVVSNLLVRDYKDVSYLGNVKLSTEYLDATGTGIAGNTLYGLLLTNKNRNDRKMHSGFLFNAIADDPLSDFTIVDGYGNTAILHENDYILVINDVESVVDIQLSDVRFIKDYTKDTHTLSVYGQNLCAEIQTLSTQLSTDLSGLSCDIMCLSTNLCAEISDLSSELCAEIKALSTSLSLDIDYLSSDMIKRDKEISDYISSYVEVSCSNLCVVVSSLINRDYKDVSFFGDVELSNVYLDPEGRAITLNTLYGLLLTNKNNPDRKLHPGFLFHANSTIQLANFEITDGIDISIVHPNDYILVVKDVDKVSNVTLKDVRFIRDYTTDLSSLSSDTYTLSSNLCVDIDHLSTNLSTDISRLSTNISIDLSVLSTNLSLDISSINNYISNCIEVSCSNLCAVVSNLLNRDYKDVSYFGDVLLSTDYLDTTNQAITINTLYGLLLTNKHDDRTRKLHPGFLFHASSEYPTQDFFVKDATETSAIVHDNDYILVVNEVSEVNQVSLSDVKFIKDYTRDTIFLSAYASNLSSDIKTLSVRLSTDIDRLSGLLCADINTLSANLSGDILSLSSNLCADINKLSISLSTDVSAISSSLCSDINYINIQINDIRDDVRGGVNYKGHIDLDAKNVDDTQKYQPGLTLSSIFGIYLSAIEGDVYATNKTLNNGWLYNITTINPYIVAGDPEFILENNDYIIIHKHGEGISCVDVSALTRENIDIIEAVQDDYVRLYQLRQLSADLSGDIDNLSSELLADIKATNDNVAYLSDEISGTVAVFDNNKQFVGNKLSAVKVTNAEYKSGVQSGTLNNKCIYVIDDLYDSAYGHQIKDLANPTELSDATNKWYVDGISTTISGDISTLSTNLSTDVKTLSVGLSTDIMNLSSSLSNSVNAEFIHLTGDLNIGTLGLTGNISAVEFATNPVHAKAVKVGPSALTYIDTSHLDTGGDEITYDIAYPEKSGTIALTSDVIDLSTVLTGEINSVSTALSIDISSTVAVFNKDKQFVGNKLSAVKVTNAEYNAMVDSSTLNDQCIYVIDDDFMSLRGQQIRNLGEPSNPTDATTKNYVDGIAGNINTNIDELSNNLCSEIQTLSTELSVTVNNEFVHISGDINVGAIEVTSTISAKSFVVTQDSHNYGAELCAKEITYNDFHDADNHAIYHLEYPKKSGTIALTSDVSALSNDLTGELNAVSTVISIELSSLVSVYDDNGNYIGNKLSAVKIDNATYAAAAKTYSLDPKCLYVIDDSYDSAFGHRIADVGDPALSADAANKKYVDGEISSLSSAVDAKFTTTEDLGQLALNVDNLSADVKYLSSDLSTLEQLHYYATLSGIENTTHSHPTEGQYPDNLLIVDHSDVPDEHKQYYLKFKYGSLVLVEVD